MTTADALPGDMPGLRAAALALIAERDELLRRVERMRQLLRQFQRAQFGRHSERLDPDQLQLALEERDIASAHRQAAAEKQAPAPRPRSEPGKRKSLPDTTPSAPRGQSPNRRAAERAPWASAGGSGRRSAPQASAKALANAGIGSDRDHSATVAHRYCRTR